METKPCHLALSLREINAEKHGNGTARDHGFSSWASDNALEKRPRLTSLSRHLRKRLTEEADIANSLSNIYIGSTPSLVEHRRVAAREDDTSRDFATRSEVAPDGGWGWAILASYFIMNFSMGYQFGNFSVIYVELVAYFNESRAIVGWVGSIFPATVFCSAVVTTPLVLRLGERAVTILGGIIATTGIALSAFLVSVPYLYFVYGFLGGLGCGMALLGTLISLQKYFDKKRALVNGIGSVGVSFGQMIAGPIARVTVEELGLQTNLALAAGVMAQIIIAGALLRPIEPHRATKVSPESPEDSKSNITDLPQDSCLKSHTKTINAMFSCSLFNNYQFVLMMLGLFFSTISIESFFGHYVSRLVFYDVSYQKAALLQMVVAVGMILGRVSSGLLGSSLCVNRLLFYAIVNAMMGLGVLLFAITSNMAGFISVGFFTGWFVGCSYATQPTVLVDLLGVEAFAGAQGFACFFIGAGFCLSIPLAGLLMEASLNYNVPFFFCGSLGILAGLILTILVITHRASWSADEIKV